MIVSAVSNFLPLIIVFRMIKTPGCSSAQSMGAGVVSVVGGKLSDAKRRQYPAAHGARSTLSRDSARCGTVIAYSEFDFTGDSAEIPVDGGCNAPLEGGDCDGDPVAEFRYPWDNFVADSPRD
ncbi:uncharacterized protein BO97DRAFT_448164 [Aspergillus homomorphus CBS 101889]|uniref:Uncharacterized protein n=1 Tax=Aspergillus homomorphus (strain CBS 101889) TaxID=1450537 RepID=A0A395IEP5_ASPHC|nr:hypothetical protein BO97DRAFT_448164 [Aspergillus homomorphus CBS 101889]RAL17653.1 hypothetical protein BO97DRAFT_448164 [Aspergillus homomorphus CBS 101889]